MNLNLKPPQQAAVNAIDGNFVVISGPGSGKTACLIQRYMQMRILGIPETDILNLSFTNAAATEMVSRVGLIGAADLFRTFHSFAIDLLKREKMYLPFKITDTIIPVYGQDFQLMKDLLKTYPAISSFKSLKDKLGLWKRKGISPEKAIEENYNAGVEFFYAHAYADYERKCREQGWLDFDDVIVETVNLLSSNEQVRNRNKKKYISIDEAQDCDDRQLNLLQLLYDGNIYFVGDEAQCVFEWRGSQPKNLSAMGQYFPGIKALYLGENFRSTPEIVSFLVKIFPVDNGLAAHMVSNRPNGPEPSFMRFADEFEEAENILGKITDVSKSAVIARTNRQLYLFQSRCLSKGIKSKILGKKDLWQQNEIKHLLDLAKKNTDDKRPAAVVLTELIKQHNLAHIYKGSGDPNESDPVQNLNDIVKMSKDKGTVEEFLDRLRKLIYARKSDKNPVLTLTTGHQAKGHEWSNVYVIGCSQGILPHKNGELGEESRILFVACSRAADKLEISFSGPRSQFLNEFEKDIKNYVKTSTI